MVVMLKCCVSHQPQDQQDISNGEQAKTLMVVMLKCSVCHWVEGRQCGGPKVLVGAVGDVKVGVCKLETTFEKEMRLCEKCSEPESILSVGAHVPLCSSHLSCCLWDGCLRKEHPLCRVHCNESRQFQLSRKRDVSLLNQDPISSSSSPSNAKRIKNIHNYFLPTELADSHLLVGLVVRFQGDGRHFLITQESNSFKQREIVSLTVRDYDESSNVHGDVHIIQTKPETQILQSSDTENEGLIHSCSGEENQCNDTYNVEEIEDAVQTETYKERQHLDRESSDVEILESLENSKAEISLLQVENHEELGNSEVVPQNSLAVRPRDDELEDVTLSEEELEIWFVSISALFNGSKLQKDSNIISVLTKCLKIFARKGIVMKDYRKYEGNQRKKFLLFITSALFQEGEIPLINVGSNAFLYYTVLTRLLSPDISWPTLRVPCTLEDVDSPSQRQYLDLASQGQGNVKHICEDMEILFCESWVSNLKNKKKPNLAETLELLLASLDNALVSCYTSSWRFREDEDCGNRFKTFMLAVGVVDLAIHQKGQLHPDVSVIMRTYITYLYTHIIACLTAYGKRWLGPSMFKELRIPKVDAVFQWVRSSPNVVADNLELLLEMIFAKSMASKMSCDDQEKDSINLAEIVSLLLGNYNQSKKEVWSERFFHVSFLILASVLIRVHSERTEVTAMGSTFSMLKSEVMLVVLDEVPENLINNIFEVVSGRFLKRNKEKLQSARKRKKCSQKENEDSILFDDSVEEEALLLERVQCWLEKEMNRSIVLFKESYFRRKTDKADATLWHTDQHEYSHVLPEKDKKLAKSSNIPYQDRGIKPGSTFYTAWIGFCCQEKDGKRRTANNALTDLAFIHPKLRAPFQTFIVFRSDVRHGGVDFAPSVKERLSIDFRFTFEENGMKGPESSFQVR
eukprot:TRINITY_DN25721_c0_g1_i1.p1 TRINITY_DN25721_c0_g1~~TRINITY_DN25721_c0_g1_i1.p1  ORF type:complete len:913 (-),score=165.82 TRINITY_DN25721_c0_g1_i1:661-3399(-)